MFAVLQASPSVPVAALVDVAQAFTPRFQVIGPFVLLDVSGLSSLFGSPDELGAALHASGRIAAPWRWPPRRRPRCCWRAGTTGSR